MRVTDQKGQLLKGLKSDFYGQNKSRKYQRKLFKNQWVVSLKSKIQANPQDWKNYYLSKYYSKFEN